MLVESILIGLGVKGGGCLQVIGSSLNHPGKRLPSSQCGLGFLRYPGGGRGDKERSGPGNVRPPMCPTSTPLVINFTH